MEIYESVRSDSKGYGESSGYHLVIVSMIERDQGKSIKSKWSIQPLFVDFLKNEDVDRYLPVDIVNEGVTVEVEEEVQGKRYIVYASIPSQILEYQKPQGVTNGGSLTIPTQLYKFKIVKEEVKRKEYTVKDMKRNGLHLTPVKRTEIHFLFIAYLDPQYYFSPEIYNDKITGKYVIDVLSLLCSYGDFQTTLVNIPPMKEGRSSLLVLKEEKDKYRKPKAICGVGNVYM